jgi:Transcriptional regulator, AbiEi antitoxin/Protein of unknown function (DUF559)
LHLDVVAGEIAAGQLGLITREQALAAGVSPGAIRHRRRTGAWKPLRHGVYAVVAAPVTWEQRVLACVLAGPVGTVASYLSAAALHDFPDVVREGLEVTVPPGTQPRITGVRIHRPQELPDHDVRVLRGIPVTSYARTLVDCTGRLSLGQVARALDAGLVDRKTTLWSVERTLAPLGAAPGRHPAQLRLLLDERRSGVDSAESRPEIRILGVLRRGGLPVPVPQHWVRLGGQRFRLDFAYPEQKVAIEYDGWDAHRSRSAFDRDRRRDRLLQLAGWIVLRFTSQTSDPEILETLRTFVR